MKRRLCPQCHKSGFVLELGLFKPSFKCQGCLFEWTNGVDGGEDFAHALNVGTTEPKVWIIHNIKETGND